MEGACQPKSLYNDTYPEEPILESFQTVFMSSEQNYQRWYDEDPVLSKAIEQLRQASSSYQAQIALNIIKIVVEHQLEEETHLSIDTLNESLAKGSIAKDAHIRRRWYDVHETLSSAMELLKDCPDDLQAQIIPTIASMIEKTLEEKACG